LPTISSTGNSWAFDPAFEAVYLLKHTKERTQAEAELIGIFLTQSPFVIQCLPEIAERIEQQLL
jgi:hypothetical protein